MDIPRHAHVLVMDGRKLLLFKNEGNLIEPHLVVATHREHASAATQDQGTERPGKVHASVGGSRSSHEQTDFHQQDEDRFVAEAADALKRDILSGDIKALIVVAAPHALGQLRKHYNDEVRRRLVGEIAKDVAGCTTDEIAAVIANSKLEKI